MILMKTVFYFLSVFAFIFASCDPTDSNFKTDIQALESTNPPVIYGNGVYGEDTVPTQTVLGPVRINPYSVQNMTQAWNNLYPTHQIQSFPPSHLYVKFSPQNDEDYKLLGAIDEMYYDFPLENELLQLGDYYPQDGRQYPELWAIVSPDFQSPISNYTVITPLFIPPYNTNLVQEAFRITDNEYSAGGDPLYIVTDGCCPECPNFPECVTVPRIGCGDDVNCPVHGGGSGGDPGGSGGGSGGGGTIAPCGCPVYSDNRKPGGCIKVKDVEHNNSFEGVKVVKVITKDTWFTEDETWTDENGCWKIDDRYYNNMWMWVKFTGPVCQVRGVKNGFFSYFAQWSHPMKDYLGKIRKNPPYNDIEVKYDIWQNKGSQAHMHWAAATVNNAVHDFHSYAGQEGIATPPRLDIFVLEDRQYGSTLMANYIPGGLQSFIGAFLPSWARRLLPDLSIGVNFKNSDRLKELTYHETAHASHFVKAGPQFWIDLVQTEENGILFHGGNPYHQAGGIVDISEAWAYHVGWLFADKHYPDPSRSDNWDWKLERFRNHENGHMPCGVFHDLKDNIPNGIESTRDACSGCGYYVISDWVQDYTTSQMFSLLSSSTKSPSTFYLKFKTNFGNNDPVKIQNMDRLFNSY